MKNNMHKFWVALCLSIAVTGFFAACNPAENTEEEDETLTISEATLKGTWEGSVEHDFGQGYPQKWRIKFDGQNYTTWHTYQTAGSTYDEVQGLKTVGDKEKGTWAYADGNLTLTPKESFSSYYQVMNPDYTLGGYVYYNYNTNTMEAETWYETPEYFLGDNPKTVWGVSLTKDALKAKINMDTFTLKKIAE